MRRLLIGILGVFALAGVGFAQERVYTGKRWEWKAVETSAPAYVETAAGEGAVLGFKTVGKHVEPAWYRPAPAPAPAPAGHVCGVRASTVGKHVEFRHFCRVEGVEKPCPGMNKAGECLAVVK